MVGLYVNPCLSNIRGVDAGFLEFPLFLRGSPDRVDISSEAEKKGPSADSPTTSRGPMGTAPTRQEAARRTAAMAEEVNFVTKDRSADDPGRPRKGSEATTAVTLLRI